MVIKRPRNWIYEYDKYLAYLESEAWTELRNRRIKKDGFKCSICGNPNNLQVHHLRYPQVLGTESISDLMTLCESCHKNIDKIRKGYRYDRRTREWKCCVECWIKFDTTEDYENEQEAIIDKIGELPGDIPVCCFIRATHRYAPIGYADISYTWIAKEKYGEENVAIKER